MGTQVTRYLSAEVCTQDDFAEPFTMEPGEVVYDAKTRQGLWACMTINSYIAYGYGKLGVGFGQKYVRQVNGELHLVEGL